MAQIMEFSGRLTRSDKRPANPGRYDLRFELHASAGDDDPLWEETVRGIEVVPGGFFRVVLGRSAPLSAQLFDNGPRWLGVRVVRKRGIDDETAPRVPVTGMMVRLAERVRALEDRLGVQPDHVEVDERQAQVLEAIEALEQRIEDLEREVESSDVEERIRALTDRVTRIDDEEDGRLIRIEDELEDLIGPDGDVVDLNERMDRIEGKAPELIANLRLREKEQSRERVGVLRKDIDQLSQTIETLRLGSSRLAARLDEIANQPPPTAEAVGAVSRQGDVMTGGLTINRGGLEVLSGGITCRGANVNSLEASHQVKAPKVICDALELRGDLTVDNTHRVIQVRAIEGRQGSARKDGLLTLNARGGAEVVIGNAEEARGAQVHGPVTGGSFHAEGVGLAQVFDVYGSIAPGQVAAMRPDGAKVEFSKRDADPAVIGVCVDQAGLSVGGSTVGGRALVVLQGVAHVDVDAGSDGIAVGDLLVAGPEGRARKAGPDAPRGAVFGKAVSPLAEGQGRIAVLVGIC
ncbi:MAG: hypothetical protein D6798_10740 [Deltaproteobacteria bacterium]|nr:MAG: hypothetical protein D6798_10740 [Deltaproteobacteria bacterium]